MQNLTSNDSGKDNAIVAETLKEVSKISAYIIQKELQ